jgi:hypothetical protein
MKVLAGNAALFCNPFDVQSIRSGIQQLLDNPQQKETLIQKGFVNCKKYAPATSAAMLSELYERLLKP